MKVSTFAAGFAAGAYVGFMLSVLVLAVDAWVAYRANAEREAHVPHVEWVDG